MLLKIDVRETELIEKIKQTMDTVVSFKDIKLTIENLPLGDIIINDDTTDCIIIERKSLRDLAASIKDGRYEEQSFRLNGLEHHNHNIYYLIEGDLQRFNTFKERLDKQTLYSAMFSISYYKGFSLLRSNSIDETAFIICNMTNKIGKDTKRVPYYSNVTSSIQHSITDVDISKTEINPEEEEHSNDNNIVNNSSKDYISVVKKVKKENITTDNIGEIMLCQIPGVSSTIALAILNKYKTLPNLIKEIQQDETCLDKISTLDSSGKSRKINKNAIASVIKFLKI